MKHLKYFGLNEGHIIMNYSDIIYIKLELIKLDNNKFYEKNLDFEEYSNDDSEFINFNNIRIKITELFKTEAIMFPTVVNSAFFKIGVYPNAIDVNIYPRDDEWFYVILNWDEKLGNGTVGNSLCFKCDQEIGLIRFLNDLKMIIDKRNI